MANQVQADINARFDGLLNALAPFTQEEYDVVPFEGSWTAGQVAEHLLKGGNGLYAVLTGNTVPTDRRPDEKIPIVKELFGNFEKKLSSPSFILPTETTHNKEAQLKRFEQLRQQLLEAAAEPDLTPTCLDRELPGLGKLTRLEWIYFIVYHTQRHIRQLENIHQALHRQAKHEA